MEAAGSICEFAPVLIAGNTIYVYCACGTSFTVCENKPFELFFPAVLNIGF